MRNNTIPLLVKNYHKQQPNNLFTNVNNVLKVHQVNNRLPWRLLSKTKQEVQDEMEEKWVFYLQPGNSSWVVDEMRKDESKCEKYPTVRHWRTTWDRARDDVSTVVWLVLCLYYVTLHRSWAEGYVGSTVGVGFEPHRVTLHFLELFDQNLPKLYIYVCIQRSMNGSSSSKNLFFNISRKKSIKKNIHVKKGRKWHVNNCHISSR